MNIQFGKRRVNDKIAKSINGRKLSKWAQPVITEPEPITLPPEPITIPSEPTTKPEPFNPWTPNFPKTRPLPRPKGRYKKNRPLVGPERYAAYRDNALQKTVSFWDNLPMGEHLISQHPLIAAYGSELAEQAYNDAVSKGANFSISRIKDIIHQIASIESGHEDQLIELAKQIVVQISGVPKDLLVADYRSGDLHVPMPLTSYQPKAFPWDKKEQKEDTKDELEGLYGEQFKLQLSEEELQQEINKRFTMNTLTQGASAHAARSAHWMADEALKKIDPQLLDLYTELMHQIFLSYWAVDYSAAAGQEQNIGVGWSQLEREGDDKKIKVHARAGLFPILVHELIKGSMELLSLHGLSSLEDTDYKKVMKVTDQLSHEHWQLQIGPAMWTNILKAKPKEITNTELFVKFGQLPSEELHQLLQQIFDNPDQATDIIQQKFAAKHYKSIRTGTLIKRAKKLKNMFGDKIKSDENWQVVFQLVKALPIASANSITEETILQGCYIEWLLWLYKQYENQQLTQVLGASSLHWSNLIKHDLQVYEEQIKAGNFNSNIANYSTYRDFHNTMSQYQTKVERSTIREQNVEKDTKEVDAQGPYKTYQLFSPEAVVEMARKVQNTWCIKGPHFAKSYFTANSTYMVCKNDIPRYAIFSSKSIWDIGNNNLGGGSRHPIRSDDLQYLAYSLKKMKVASDFTVPKSTTIDVTNCSIDSLIDGHIEYIEKGHAGSIWEIVALATPPYKSDKLTKALLRGENALNIINYLTILAPRPLRPWPAAEKIIATNAQASFDYATKVLGHRFKEGEHSIFGQGGLIVAQYIKRILKTKVEPSIEKQIFQDGQGTHVYLSFLRLNKPEQALSSLDVLAENTAMLIRYLDKVNWPEAELALKAKNNELSQLMALLSKHSTT